MRPTLYLLLASALALPASIPAACAAPDEAAKVEAGKAAVSWSVEADEAQRAKGRVQFSLTRRTANSRWTHSNTRPLAELAGLGAGQLGSPGGTPVRFRIERDAGAIVCEGTARRWRGSGECEVAPNPAFVAALKQRGHGRPTDTQLFSLALHDIGFAFLDELKRQDYSRPDVADLVRAGDHGADLDYLKAMGASGYRVGKLDALIRMRDHGVTADYVGELARLGIKDLSADELVRMRDHGVMPDFIHGFRAAGYVLPSDQLIRLRDHGVTADYVRQLAGYGLRGVPVDELVRLRDHGVSADFVGEAARLGYRFPTSELIRLRDHGVTAAYLGELRSLGYAGLAAGDIVRLRTHGVTADFIGRANRGGARRSAAELVALRTGS